eukprot:CAMPEP_0194394544 /NCGR_PEP_ID=MMETSP0174-20130528/123911_1 /TAXON_ID=216777 /ORGANISM="Proboscia alata, Strain PI-D3" /LENGTH=450 /DNA_ID=CAMNT_0039190353 /DNA_START=211 /DNA_END=1563 /DNA_ORIENTATION=+
MSKNANKKFAILLNEQQIRWKEIRSLIALNLTSSAPIMESAKRQALKKSCQDKFVCKSTLLLLLQKTDIDLNQRVKLIVSAVRCHNISALKTLINHDTSILYKEVVHGRGDTLLHLLCEKCGWNEEVRFVLKATLENAEPDNWEDHHGMFQMNLKMKTPFKLALDSGCELENVIEHLRREFLAYFISNLEFLPAIFAEYGNDMAVFEKLIKIYPQILKANSEKYTPLYYACYYQNREMIQMLFNYYVMRGDRRKKLISRLLIATKSKIKTPLGHLVLGLGSMDSDNAFDCVKVIMSVVANFHILNIIVDKMWDDVVDGGMCLRTIVRIVDRLEVDPKILDDNGRTVLSLLIMKMASNYCTESQQVLEYLLTNFNAVASVRDGKNRLPLHIACEKGLRWSCGLKNIVEANVFALEEFDDREELLPFALSASCPSSDLNTVYQLLRHNPGIK